MFIQAKRATPCQATIPLLSVSFEKTPLIAFSGVCCKWRQTESPMTPCMPCMRTNLTTLERCCRRFKRTDEARMASICVKALANHLQYLTWQIYLVSKPDFV